MPSNFLEKIEELQKYVEIFQDGFESCADTKINTSFNRDVLLFSEAIGTLFNMWKKRIETREQQDHLPYSVTFFVLRIIAKRIIKKNKSE